MAAHDAIPKVLATIALILAAVYVFVHPPTDGELGQKQVAVVETATGWGSAVAFKVRGSDRVFFLTAKHVVDGRTDLKIRMESHVRGFKAGHFEVPAQVLLMSPGSDSAILTIPPVAWPFRSAEIQRELPSVGDEVYAVGNMHGANFDGSVSDGVVAQLGVFPDAAPTFPWPIVDQTSAINLPGSSGGAVFSRRTGKLLGIQVGNYQQAVFLYLPARVLLAQSRAEGWGWLFGDGHVPSEQQIQDLLKPKLPGLSVTNLVSISKIATNAPEARKAPRGLDPELKRGHR